MFEPTLNLFSPYVSTVGSKRRYHSSRVCAEFAKIWKRKRIGKENDIRESDKRSSGCWISREKGAGIPDQDSLFQTLQEHLPAVSRVEIVLI